MELEKIANVLEVMTLVSNVIILIFLSSILVALFTKRNSTFKKFAKIIQKNYLEIGLIVSLVATLGSLFYSEILGYAPCKLCWYQRILMYPQVILFAVALKKRKSSLALESVILSGIGLLVAAYHYIIQIGLLDSTGCEIVGYSSKCSEFFTLNYGYITIPLMAVTAFAMILIAGIIHLHYSKKRFF